ncbi:MAG: polymorphic toxin-type HINT domain-containing protein [Caldilineaceae bacterium]
MGDIYDAVTAILGYDPLTGDTLSNWKRGLALAAALLPFIAASHLRAANTALDGLGDLAHLANRACSFDEDTPVATADGPIPIAEIDIGDQVLAYDEATGATAYYTVTATMSHMDPVVVTLTIDGEQIETTPEHPFYAAVSAPWLAVGQTAWRWTPAAELEAGDRVYQSDGTTGVVQALVVEAAPQLMYNMTVAQAHTYAVGDGQWVVHNSCNWLRGGKSSDRIGNILAKDAQFFWNQLPRGHKTVIAVAQGGDHKIVTAFIGASDDALKTLEKFASQRGAKYIAPFEDPSIWGSGHAEQVAYNYFRQYFSNATDLRIGVSHPDGPCGRYCRPFFSRENFFRVFWQ